MDEAVAALDEAQVAALLLLLESNPPSAALAAIKVLGTVLSNLSGGEFFKYGSLKTSAKVLQTKLLTLLGGPDALISFGFVSDEAAGTYTWPAETLGAAVASTRAAVVKETLSMLETLRDAIAGVGDTNPPGVATEAVKLMGTYLGNLLAQPSDERRRVSRARATGRRLLIRQRGALGEIAHPWSQIRGSRPSDVRPWPLVVLTQPTPQGATGAHQRVGFGCAYSHTRTIPMGRTTILKGLTSARRLDATRGHGRTSRVRHTIHVDRTTILTAPRLHLSNSNLIHVAQTGVPLISGPPISWDSLVFFFFFSHVIQL